MAAASQRDHLLAPAGQYERERRADDETRRSEGGRAGTCATSRIQNRLPIILQLYRCIRLSIDIPMSRCRHTSRVCNQYANWLSTTRCHMMIIPRSRSSIPLDSSPHGNATIPSNPLKLPQLAGYPMLRHHDLPPMVACDRKKCSFCHDCACALHVLDHTCNERTKRHLILTCKYLMQARNSHVNALLPIDWQATCVQPCV